MLKRVFLILFLVGFAVSAAIAWEARQALTTPVGGDIRSVQIKPGSSFRRIVQLLDEASLFDAPHHRYYFRAWARLRGQASRVRSGEYEIEPGMTLPGVLEVLVSGKNKQYRITIVEGATFAEMRALVAAHDAIDHTLAGQDDSVLMRAIGAEGEHPEGRFMPDTYHFPRGFADVDFYRRAYSAMSVFLEKAWAERADNLPIETPYEALILASIIEKETAVPAERGQIAGVFTRRLQIDMPLQTDPVIIYGIPDFDGNIRRSHLRADGPYNSYRRKGLPPTPIALPARASIRAALNPVDGKALYFVSKGDGSHKFSETLPEHNRAVRKYQLNQ